MSGGKYTTMSFQGDNSLPSRHLATSSDGQILGKAAVTEYGREKFAQTDVSFVNVDAGLVLGLSVVNPRLHC